MKIHLIGDSPKMNSGYATVIRNLSIGLKKLGYDVSCTGLQTIYTNEYLDDIQIMPIQSDKTEDVGQVMNNIQNIGPDIVIYVGNLGDTDNELPQIAKVFPGTWCHVPINGRDIPLGIANDLNKVIQKGGKVIAMCQYGYNEMKRVGINVDKWIYHGYNNEVFKKIDVKIDVKSITNNGSKEIVSILKWDKEADIGGGKKGRWTQYDIEADKVPELLEYGKRFLYLHVGQNIGIRKRQERLLTAYAIMIKESRQFKDRTQLHMHCLPISGRGLNLIEVVMKLGIQENISFSYGQYLSAGWSSEALNVLYNISDIHVSASSSEGFGIPTLESMACGKANIAPNCTSFTELIGNEYGSNLDDASKNRGLLANIESWHMEPSGRFKSLVDQKDLATMMKKIYMDKKLRESLGDNGMDWVKQYTWNNVIKQWDALLKQMV
jgi:glycosyltransferase involved in cell wall biosynthesis